MLQARTPNSVIEIGAGVAFSNNVSVVAMEKVVIGSGTLVGDLVTIMDSDFHEIDPSRRRDGTGMVKPVYVGENVWLGSRVIVQKGVSIGNNSIVTPQSVVTRDIPPNCIAGGIPARVIRQIGA